MAELELSLEHIPASSQAASGRMTYVLGALGLLPFAGLALALMPGLEPAGLNVRLAFVSYSAIILSFLAGTLWGRSIATANQDMRMLLVLSNLLALAAWLAILVQALASAVIILGVGFLAMRITEIRCRAQIAPARTAAYERMRDLLTSIVLIIHAIVLVLVALPA